MIPGSTLHVPNARGARSLLPRTVMHKGYCLQRRNELQTGAIWLHMTELPKSINTLKYLFVFIGIQVKNADCMSFCMSQ